MGMLRQAAGRRGDIGSSADSRGAGGQAALASRLLLRLSQRVTLHMFQRKQAATCRMRWHSFSSMRVSATVALKLMPPVLRLVKLMAGGRLIRQRRGFAPPSKIEQQRNPHMRDARPSLDAEQVCATIHFAVLRLPSHESAEQAQRPHLKAPLPLRGVVLVEGLLGKEGSLFGAGAGAPAHLLRRTPTLSSSAVRMARCACGRLASSTISSRSALLHTAITCRPRPAPGAAWCVSTRGSGPVLPARRCHTCRRRPRHGTETEQQCFLRQQATMA